MQVVSDVKTLRRVISQWHQEGLTVGLVPTMGYLHEGHVSLVKTSVKYCDRSVVSVFVNPTQFGPSEDLEAYPRDLLHDHKVLEESGADLMFCPPVSEMYPEGAAAFVSIESDLIKVLCGKTRPIHFKGVCTVVAKLFNLVNPDYAFFGQKDAQQLAVIKKMVRDLLLRVKIVGCPIIREADGLAKSSRNVYLNPQERQAALVLSKALKLAAEEIRKGERSTAVLIGRMRGLIEQEPLAEIDYVEMVDGRELQPKDTVEEGMLTALAVYIGKTRLIDNFTVDETMLRVKKDA